MWPEIAINPVDFYAPDYSDGKKLMLSSYQCEGGGRVYPQLHSSDPAQGWSRSKLACNNYK